MITRRAMLAMPLAAAAQAEPLRLLVITGGHLFEEEPFVEVFRSLKGMQFTHERFGQGAAAKLRPEATAEFDAMVFYDMNQNPQPHWDAWMRLLEKGMPTVFLHHALGSYRKMPQYLDVVGGRANFTTKILPGEISTLWKHDEEIPVRIADPAHPITRGLEPFVIRDEVYKGYYVRPDVHVLLTADHPRNGHEIAWTHHYGNSAIVYLQLGHDHFAYQNPNFRTLLERSIRWTVGRP